MRVLLICLAIIALTPTSHARGFFKSVVRPFEKATEWAGKQSGITPTMDNANEAARKAQEAAKAAEAAVVEMKPKANAAMDSITRTSSAAGDILIWIKWPIVISAYCLAVWLASVAVRGWSGQSVKIGALPVVRDLHPRSVDSHGSPPQLSFGGRFRWLFFGCAVFFYASYSFFLEGTESFRDRDTILAFAVFAAVASVAAGILLALLPLRRPITCAAMGVFVPAVTLACFTYACA